MSSSASAATTLRFGVVGLGRAATSTVPAIARHPRTRIVAAADADAAVLERFCAQYPARAYARIEDLCADPDVDAVYIATPTQLHTQHVLTAAGAGKHAIVEKPLAITLRDADRMLEATDRAGVQVIVGQSQSFEPPIRVIREIVKSEQLGRLGTIGGWYFTDWLYRPRLPAELDTRLGGGVVFRQGAHHFDIVRLIGGGLLRSVRAATSRWDSSRPTEGSYSAFLEFESGASANLIYTGYDHFMSTELTSGITEGGTRVRFQQRKHGAARRALSEAGDAALKATAGFGGTHFGAAAPHQAHFGLLAVSCERGDIRQTADGLRVYGDEACWKVSLPVGVTGRDLMVAEFYDAVAYGAPALHGLRWGKATLEVSLAVLESASTRREVLLRHQIATAD